MVVVLLVFIVIIVLFILVYKNARKYAIKRIFKQIMAMKTTDYVKQRLIYLVGKELTFFPLAQSKESYLTVRLNLNNFRIIYESLEIIKGSSNYDTIQSRVEVIILTIYTLLGVYFILDKRPDSLAIAKNTINTVISRIKPNPVNNEIRNAFEFASKILTESQKIDMEIEAILNRTQEDVCPYCSHKFDNPPRRRRKCPECKQPIVRVKIKNSVYLITEESSSVISTLKESIISHLRDNVSKSG